MKCPECAANGQTSKVYVGHSTATLMASVPFYDEDGNYHHNDPNIYTTRYSCSNGHKFSKSIGGGRE